jgi:Acetolactate synthase, small (regulatory) subunit
LIALSFDLHIINIHYEIGVKIEMHVISLIVKNEFGVMQRIMGEFTRNKINVETIVVGKCELPGKARMVLSVIGKEAVETALSRLNRLQDVYCAQIVEEDGQSAYALITTTNGLVGLIGKSADVEEIIERTKPERYVKTLSAL